MDHISHSPAQDTQHKIEDKEGAENDQRHKINPRQLKTNGIIHLIDSRRQKGKIEMYMVKQVSFQPRLLLLRVDHIGVQHLKGT